MSSKKYASPLNVELKPSYLLFTFLLTIHFGSIMLLWPAPIAWWAKLFFSAIVVFSLWYTGSRALLSRPNGIVSIYWDENDQWFLHSSQGKVLEAVLRHDSILLSGIVILNFTVDGGRSQSVIITPGVLHPETFRKLRVRLKITHHSDPEPDPM